MPIDASSPVQSHLPRSKLTASQFLRTLTLLGSRCRTARGELGPSQTGIHPGTGLLPAVRIEPPTAVGACAPTNPPSPLAIPAAEEGNDTISVRF